MLLLPIFYQSLLFSCILLIIICNTASISVDIQTSFRAIFSLKMKEKEAFYILQITRASISSSTALFFPSMNGRSCPQPPHPHCPHVLIFSCLLLLVFAISVTRDCARASARASASCRYRMMGEDGQVRSSSWKLKCIYCKQLSSPKFEAAVCLHVSSKCLN